MTYEFKDNVLNVYQDGKLNLVQPYNPVTGQPFESKEDATDWIVKYIKDFYNASPLHIDIQFQHEDDIVTFSAKNIVPVDDMINIFIQDSTVEDGEECVMTIVGEDYLKQHTIKFENGEARKSIFIDRAGEYTIYIDGVSTAHEDKVFVHTKNSFIVQ